MYKSVYVFLPFNFKFYFLNAGKVHNHSQKKFLLNSSRHGHKSLVNQCSKLWTKMQNDLKDQDYFV